MKEWKVYVQNGALGTVCLGTVDEETENAARCAALSRWGVDEDELKTMGSPNAIDLSRFILPDSDFSVSRA